jgi:hypothetical protein
MRRALVIGVVAAALLATASRRAAAYPQYQLSRDQTCSGCHLSPAGGGLLSENGYSVAENLAQLTDSSAFMYGLIPLPGWLAVGGDLRSSTGFIHTPDSNFAFIPMQADVYLHAMVQGFTVHVTAGARPPQWITGNGTPAIFDRFWSREHYLMWQQDATSRDGLFVRAGRFMPVFGLRLAEHPVYIRRFGGTPLYGETYGAAVEYVTQAWEAHLTGFVEDPLIDAVLHDSGVAAYAELRLDPRLQVGGELMVIGRNDNQTWVRGGATAKLYLPSTDLLIQGELQVAHQSIGGGHAPNQIIGYAMASKFLGSAFLLDVGLGHFDEDLAISGLDRDNLDVNLHFFFDSHFELVWQNRLEGLGVFQSRGGPTGGWSLLHAHYRL